MFTLILKKQKISHDKVDCDDSDSEVYAVMKKPRMQESRGKGFKGINNSRIDPINAQIRAQCEAETLVIRKDYERERKRVKKQNLRLRNKYQVSFLVFSLII